MYIAGATKSWVHFKLKIISFMHTGVLTKSTILIMDGILPNF